MNKKGIFMPVLAIFTLIICSWAFYIIAFGSNKDYSNSIGRNQFELYNIYMDGEKNILYVDNAAKLAGYDTIFEMADNGGYDKDEISRCYKTAGYNVWYTKTDDCFPKELSKKFEEIFKKNFNLYMKNYNEKLDGYYELSFIHADKINANGKGKERFLFQARDGEIKYWINMDFSHDIEYNFADYNEIKVLITEPIKLCNTAECFNRVIDKKNYDWKIVDREGYVLFDVNTKKIIFNQPIVVKFALNKNS